MTTGSLRMCNKLPNLLQSRHEKDSRVPLQHHEFC